jgi:hypothetical protein
VAWGHAGEEPHGARALVFPSGNRSSWEAALYRLRERRLERMLRVITEKPAELAVAGALLHV